MPSPAKAEAEQAGRRKMVAGAVLMGVGLGLNLAGFAVTVVNVISIIVNIHNKVATPDEFTRATPGSIVGTALTAGGYVCLIGGIVTMVVGGKQMKRAQQMSAGLVPVFDRGGGGGVMFGLGATF